MSANYNGIGPGRLRRRSMHSLNPPMGECLAGPCPKDRLEGLAYCEDCYPELMQIRTEESIVVLP